MVLECKKHRALSVRSKIKRCCINKLRLSVFKSNRHFYAQLIDDNNNKTILHVSTLSHEIQKIACGRLNKEMVEMVGALFVEKYSNICHSADIVFDRGYYRYAGIVSDFLSVVRASGIKI